MRVEIFCCCQSVKSDGPFRNLNGVFSLIASPSERVILPPFVVVAAIRIEPQERGTYAFRFVVKDSNGTVLTVTENQETEMSYQNDTSGVFWFQHQIPRAELRYGEYRFSIERSGKQLAETRLRIVPSSPLPGVHASN